MAIIGGGASGVFCAIRLGNHPDREVHIFEKTRELLQKVKISGGGRCNVTHQYYSPAQFSKNYPRGGQVLKKNLPQFSSQDMYNWLEQEGVKLKTEVDGRVFPVSDNSQTIIDCFIKNLQKCRTLVHLNTEIQRIELYENKFILNTEEGSFSFDTLVIASGGARKPQDMNFYQSLSIASIPIVPSLFTFKIQDKTLTELMGLSVKDVSISIVDSPYKEIGDTLITHWGLSGPAILKLSAWAAFLLNEREYNFKIKINWMGQLNEEQCGKEIDAILSQHHLAKVSNYYPTKFPYRFWLYLLTIAGIEEDRKWGEVSKKQKNKLLQTLTNTQYEVRGKTTFKEEFVTAGGIDIANLNPQTMEHKTIVGLYCIGEATNIDGITGGFNFQNAWTSAAICAKNILEKKE